MVKKTFVLITRPHLAALQTKDLLAKYLLAEHLVTSLILPFTEIKSLPFPVLTRKDKIQRCHALLATSANVFLHPFFQDRQKNPLSPFLHMPLYCVGAHTAQVARNSGFVTIAAIASNVEELCHMVLEKDHRHFLYLTGTIRRPVLETYLQDHGATVFPLILYETHKPTITKSQLDLLPDTIDFILLYSVQNIEMLLALSDKITKESQLLCLSERIASHIPACILGKKIVAKRPTEQELLALLSHCF